MRHRFACSYAGTHKQAYVCQLSVYFVGYDEDTAKLLARAGGWIIGDTNDVHICPACAEKAGK